MRVQRYEIIQYAGFIIVNYLEAEKQGANWKNPSPVYVLF